MLKKLGLSEEQIKDISLFFLFAVISTSMTFVSGGINDYVNRSQVALVSSISQVAQVAPAFLADEYQIYDLNNDGIFNNQDVRTIADAIAANSNSDDFDLDNNGRVDEEDVLMTRLALWEYSDQNNDIPRYYDINQDGIINNSDVRYVADIAGAGPDADEADALYANVDQYGGPYADEDDVLNIRMYLWEYSDQNNDIPRYYDINQDGIINNSDVRYVADIAGAGPDADEADALYANVDQYGGPYADEDDVLNIRMYLWEYSDQNNNISRYYDLNLDNIINNSDVRYIADVVGAGPDADEADALYANVDQYGGPYADEDDVHTMRMYLWEYSDQNNDIPRYYDLNLDGHANESDVTYVANIVAAGPDADEADALYANVDPYGGPYADEDDLLSIETFVEENGSGNPTVTVMSPNGGERISTYTARQVIWESQGLDGRTLSVYAMRQGGGSTYTIATNLPSSRNNVTWIVPVNATLGEYKIYIFAIAPGAAPVSDSSDATFTVIQGSPPRGGGGK